MVKRIVLRVGWGVVGWFCWLVPVAVICGLRSVIGWVIQIKLVKCVALVASRYVTPNATSLTIKVVNAMGLVATTGAQPPGGTGPSGGGGWGGRGLLM